MERKIIEIEVGQSLEIDTDYYYGAKGFCIIELIEFLRKATDDGATYIKIRGNNYDGAVDAIDIQPLNAKIESDEDFAKRASEEESKRLAFANEIKAREKALYEELKLKYGT